MRASFSAFTIGLVASVVFVTGAMAGVGPWAEFDGGRARLLSDTNVNEATGQAWLEIELQAGWKTYWLEPGDGGVPPSITLQTGGQTIEPDLTMPAPTRFRDPNTVWAGYTDRTYISMTYPVSALSSPARLQASAFLGVCREICIPVKLDLTAPPTDQPTVATATERMREVGELPAAFSPGGVAPTIEQHGDTLTVTFEGNELKGAEGAELFVASTPRGLRLATPSSASDYGEGKLQFQVPILKQKSAIEDGNLGLLLSLATGSYQGEAPLPHLK
ncbi:protein-disulfide reductase DsbD domain-containing protein [Notoacmeibacter marinus]|uniref:protein-disulfide reductase DsbD domain-containing protein n=1 Tax=Notoacmeibacter marinus TaxID=1876515 RepID=UPI000DF1F2E9|nr:protein-disulfide reductase DsbD domain-containing protein [Notoacmeibacter marinus]